jgi:site-specific DNA-methyltransferase (adenine-specific)
MKFDVIVGNPPYQMSDGGAQASAMPIYHKFVQQAKKMNPRYLTMIIPARWYSGGKGLDKFRDEMLNDDRIRILHDYIRADDVFPGVEIKGGVCYFLWDNKNRGPCRIYTHDSNGISSSERPLLENGATVFIRYNTSVFIYNKVKEKRENSFCDIVSSRKPFGLTTDFHNFKYQCFDNAIELYANKKNGFVDKKLINQNQDWIDKIKIFAPKAWGVGNMMTDWIKPFIVGTNTCCTETYLVIGPFENKNIAENVYSYMQTKFFHLMLSFRKITQDTTKKVYSFVPMQDFSEPWTDEKLYAKYGITAEEQAFIESMIRPMEVEK